MLNPEEINEKAEQAVDNWYEPLISSSVSNQTIIEFHRLFYDMPIERPKKLDQFGAIMWANAIYSRANSKATAIGRVAIENTIVSARGSYKLVEPHVKFKEHAARLALDSELNGSSYSEMAPDGQTLEFAVWGVSILGDKIVSRVPLPPIIQAPAKTKIMLPTGVVVYRDLPNWYMNARKNSAPRKLDQMVF